MESWGIGPCPIRAALEIIHRATYASINAQYFEYDDENQFSIWTSTNNLKTAFIYDGLSRLRKRIEYQWSSGTNYMETSQTRYIYDGMTVVQERNSGNTPQVHYMRGPDLSSSLQGAGGIGGLVARLNGYSSSVGTWSTLNSYHADGNGNITYIVDSTQAAAATYKYNPFGGTISSSGSLATGNIYRFSSKEIHANTGLYYYGYRFYDPGLGRWLNRDPLSDAGFDASPRGTTSLPGRTKKGKSTGSNLYSFCLNRPITAYDFLGLVERGPGSVACKQATEQAEAAWDLYDSEPSDENLEAAIALSALAAAYCAPPPPPPKPPSPPPRWWQCIPPIWRWPILIPPWMAPGWPIKPPVEA